MAKDRNKRRLTYHPKVFDMWTQAKTERKKVLLSRFSEICKTQISAARGDTSADCIVGPAMEDLFSRVSPVLCQLHNDGSS